MEKIKYNYSIFLNFLVYFFLIYNYSEAYVCIYT